MLRDNLHIALYPSSGLCIKCIYFQIAVSSIMSFSSIEAAALCFSQSFRIAFSTCFPLFCHSQFSLVTIISDNVSVKFQWEMQLDWLFRNPFSVLIRTPPIIPSFSTNSSTILPIFQITFCLSSCFTISNPRTLSVFSFDLCFILCFPLTSLILSNVLFAISSKRTLSAS